MWVWAQIDFASYSFKEFGTGAKQGSQQNGEGKAHHRHAENPPLHATLC